MICKGTKGVIYRKQKEINQCNAINADSKTKVHIYITALHMNLIGYKPQDKHGKRHPCQKHRGR